LLELLLIFVVGFASDFLIVRYYLYLSEGRIFAAVVSNSLIFVVNVVFVGLAGSGNISQLCAYLIGQNAGIATALWFSGGNIVGRNTDQ
jgi:uncharacterized protein YebE (UPF0316 family)